MNSGIADRLKRDAVRFYKNGISTIKKVPIREGIYTDVKPIHEATAIIYRGMLKALDAFFLLSGLPQDKLPKDKDEYRKLLRRYSAMDGKIIKAFNIAYNSLHIRGYYGEHEAEVPEVINPGIENARRIIEKLLGIKIV
jgi:hypothetical protein